MLERRGRRVAEKGPRIYRDYLAPSLLRHPSPPVPALNLIWGEVHRLIGLVHPQVGAFSSMVNRRLNDHAAAARIRAIDVIGFDNSPFAGRAPILIELCVAVLGVL